MLHAALLSPTVGVLSGVAGIGAPPIRSTISKAISADDQGELLLLYNVYTITHCTCTTPSIQEQPFRY